MTTCRHRPLSLEPFEDRVLPSSPGADHRFPGGMDRHPEGETWDRSGPTSFGPVGVGRPERSADGPRSWDGPGGFRPSGDGPTPFFGPTGPGNDEGRRTPGPARTTQPSDDANRSVTAVAVAEVSTAPTVTLRSAAAVEAAPAESAPGATPVATAGPASGAGLPHSAAPLPTAGWQAPAPSGTVAPLGESPASAGAAGPASSSAGVGRPLPVPPGVEPAAQATPRDVGTAGWAVYVGTTASAAAEGEPPTGDPAIGGGATDPGPAVVPVEYLPMPAVVGQLVVDAVFPGGVPLSGVLPVDVAAIEAGAGALLGGLADLGAEVAGGWDAPERWAWMTAAALVAGGVAHAAHARPGRGPPGRAPAGTDSALARWEERRADRTC